MSDPKIFVIDRNCDEKGMRVTNFDKWTIAGIIAVLFFIFSLPFIYNISNAGAKLIGARTVSKHGCPSIFGILVHAIIFLIIIRLLMH